MIYFLSICVASDGTLNPAGVRFGSADIYNIGNGGVQWCVCVLVEGCVSCTVEHMDIGIADSLCVGQRYRGDERVILFLKMAPGQR